MSEWNREAICPAWLDDSNLSVHAFRVYLHVSRRASGRRGWCNASVVKMAEVCGMKRQTVSDRLDELVERGLIELEGKGRNRRWRPTKPPEKLESGAADVSESGPLVPIRTEESDRMGANGPETDMTESAPLVLKRTLSEPLTDIECPNGAPKGSVEGNEEGDLLRMSFSEDEILRAWGKLSKYPESLGAITRSLEMGATPGEIMVGTRRLWTVVMELGARSNRFLPGSLSFFGGEQWREDAADWRTRFAGDGEASGRKAGDDEEEDVAEWG